VKATEVTAGLAESNGSLQPGLWRDSLHVTCGLTACTPGSAPGPTLGNEYGKTFYLYLIIALEEHTHTHRPAVAPSAAGSSAPDSRRGHLVSHSALRLTADARPRSPHRSGRTGSSGRGRSRDRRSRGRVPTSPSLPVVSLPGNRRRCASRTA